MTSEDYTVIDWRGNPVKVGSRVLYPRMSGRSCEMQEGIIEEVKPFADTRWNPDTREREEFTNHKFKIIPTASSRGFSRWSGQSVWIQIGENVTAVTGA